MALTLKGRTVVALAHAIERIEQGKCPSLVDMITIVGYFQKKCSLKVTF